MKFIFLLLTVSLYSHATQPTEYYWGMADTLSGSGAHGSTLVIGKREYPDGAKIDTQLYFSSSEGPSEYTYIFHEESKKMEVKLEGEDVGAGSFACDAKKHCTYKYEITKGSPYKSEGSDTPQNKNGVLYRESSWVLYPNAKTKDTFKATYLILDEAGYKKLRGQILKK